MAKLMDNLGRDHQNVASLLELLDRQLTAVHDVESADFELMRDVMLYMTAYPDTVHHPLEDLVFERLAAAHPPSQDLVDQLAREHRDLARKGAKFRELLIHVVDGGLVARADLETTGRDYVGFLVHHMALEDEKAFPLARTMLGKKDWQWVQGQLKATEDPIFGPVREQQFASLFRHIEDNMPE